MFLMRPAIARLGERRALITGLALGTVAFALMGYAPNGMVVIAAIAITALWGAGRSARAILDDPSRLAERAR